MKKILFLALALAFVSVGCNKDDDETFVLKHEGDNNSAPLLDGDVYVAAARFNSNITNAYSGAQMESIDFYLLDLPSTCAIIIYGEGTASTPGPVLYSSTELSNEISGSSWNTHVLSSPIDILGDDLWIGVEVSHIQSIRTVGCDNGPAIANGDWIHSASNNEWETLRSFTSDPNPENEVSINWNIRGNLKEN